MIGTDVNRQAAKWHPKVRKCLFSLGLASSILMKHFTFKQEQDDPKVKIYAVLFSFFPLNMKIHLKDNSQHYIFTIPYICIKYTWMGEASVWLCRHYTPQSMGRKDTKISINPWLALLKTAKNFFNSNTLDQYLGKKRMRKFYDYVILYTFHLRNLINGMKYLPIYLTFNCFLFF